MRCRMVRHAVDWTAWSQLQSSHAVRKATKLASRNADLVLMLLRGQVAHSELVHAGYVLQRELLSFN